MAPKRSVKVSALDKTVKAIPGKFSGKRQKKQPLKLPNTLEISTPISNNMIDVPDTLRKVDVGTKIALANEVAMSQLLNMPVNVRSNSPPPKKKRGKQKKRVESQFFDNKDGGTIETGDATDAPDVKKATKKSPARKPPERRILTRKRIADSSIQSNPTIKQQKITTLTEALIEAARKEKLKAQEDAAVKPDTTVKNPSENKSVEPPNSFNPPNVATKRKKNLSLKGKQHKVATRPASPILQTRCVKRPIVVKSCQEPTIKSQTTVNEKAQIVQTPKRRTRSDNSAGPVGSRQTSTSSSSNMSWTRDISSSSATNSIILSSNDFVRFNKKLPVIKLTNIDHEVNKPKPTSVANKGVIISDYTESSDTESELSKVKKPQLYGNARPLNLSASSCNSSVTQIVNVIPSSNCNNKNYGKAAENLMHVLKKMDMEFINWIHETDFVSSDLNKIKDKLFNILKSEVCALTHCRNLQQISNPDAMIDVNNCKVDKIDNSNENQDKIDNSNENENTQSNLVEQREDRNNKSVPIERDSKEINKNNTASPIKFETNNNNILSNNKSMTVTNKPIINNKIENINVKPSGSKKVDDNRSITVERNKPECDKSNLVDHVTNETNKFHTKHSVTSVNKVDNNKINDIDHNRLLSNRFKNSTLGKGKGTPIENIRIEINRSGAKKIGYKSLEIDDTMYNENNNVGCNSVENNTSAYSSSEIIKATCGAFETNVTSNSFEQNNNGYKPVEVNQIKDNSRQDHSIQNKLDEDKIRPSTSGISSDKFNETSRTHNASSDSSESDSSSDNEQLRYEKRCDQSPHDDDDALSLFAESLTGMETSRVNTSVIYDPSTKKEFEEYVPEPIQSAVVPPNNYSYSPTKISEQAKNGVVKTVCEKQNADSTSIYKDKDAVTPTYQDSNSSTNINESSPTKPNYELNSPQNRSRPLLMEHYIQIKPRDFNTIFIGYCIPNLMCRCPLVQMSHLCRYSHDIPSEQEVKKKIMRLDKELFTKEYMIIRRKSIMLFRFGISFLYECARRNYTRMLVEMSFDFTMRIRSGDPMRDSLKLTAVELALLHLNNVDLSVCEDLLLLEVNEESLLCDVFMQTMTCTQNFSRFKPVFLSLTYFLVNNDRTFSLEITEQVLERLCILPFDEPVIRALIQIMRLTDPEIFLNSKIEQFEKLISVNSDVSDEYWALKKEVNLKGLAKRVEESPSNAVHQTPTNQTVDQLGLFIPVEHSLIIQPLIQPLRVQTMEPPLINRPEGVPLPPSPDTTHLDNMVKSAEDTVVPKITRIVRGIHPNANTQSCITPSPSNSDDVNPSPHYRNWLNRSIFNKINRSNFSPIQPMRPPVRLRRPPHRPQMRKLPFGERRLVTFGGSPIMYPPPESDF